MVRAVLRAARYYLDIGAGPSELSFSRLEDVRITAGNGWNVDRRDDVWMDTGAAFGEGEDRVVLRREQGGIPFLDDEGGREYHLTDAGYRRVYWSRDPLATLLGLARNGRTSSFGAWRG